MKLVLEIIQWILILFCTGYVIKNLSWWYKFKRLK